MRSLKNLNIKKSIEQNKLIYSEDWLDKFGTIVLYLFFSWGFILPFLIFFDSYRNYSKTGFEYYLLFIFSLFCAFTIYRKATEKQLTKIIGKYNAEENKLLINQYCEKKGFEKHRNSGNVIIYNKLNYLALNQRFQTSRIFLLHKNDIYFTMIKENQKMNIPVLFSQISLKRDIRNLCQ
ncbi:hypothetical protein [Flavobacterium aquidurense]|uniref:Uncharacterized protein n=1 Tax=Flavobacterium aquidurense TaxID=362413 RepID=A0A0Q0RQY7_9FLAO|nr:hypothetical protein [Flavobacterium aquidurense]KQB38811.1 hypothetical protein RC62_2174 [Flavobacterium aquidurense]